MKFSLATVVWLLVGLAGLVSAYSVGFLEAHPAVMTLALGFYKVLGSLLGPLVERQLPEKPVDL